MPVETHRTFCRFCHANCAMLVDIEDGKVEAVRGDPDDREYGGYTCMKGRELPDSHNAAHRLHHSLVRGDDGEFRETPMLEALGHVSNELRRIIDRYGPDSVAVFIGSGGHQNSGTWAGSHRFAHAMGRATGGVSCTRSEVRKGTVSGTTVSGRRRFGTAMAPMPIATPATIGRPGRWERATPSAAPMNMDGNTGPPRNALSESP